MIDSLRRIKEAETKANERIAAAKKESESMLNKAEVAAKDITDKAAESAQNKAAEMMQKACSDAGAEAEKIIRAGVEISSEIKKNAENQVGAAAKIILNRITGEV